MPFGSFDPGWLRYGGAIQVQLGVENRTTAVAHAARRGTVKYISLVVCFAGPVVARAGGIAWRMSVGPHTDPPTSVHEVPTAPGNVC